MISLALGAAIMLAPPSGAADRSLAPPEGWHFDPHSPYAMTADGIAVASYQGNSYSSSRITQLSGLSGARTTAVHTDVPGKAWRLEYSPDETLLLVHHTLPGSRCEGPIQTTMLDASGHVRWTREDARRMLWFSTTGEALLAASGGALGVGEVEVVSLSGKSERTIATGGLDHVLLIGDGRHALVSAKGVTSYVRLDDTLGAVWSFNDRCRDERRMIVSYVLDSDRVVIVAGSGCFQVVRLSDGAVEYDYDPERMPAEPPTRAAAHWVGYDPFEGPTAGTLTLFDGSAAGYTLDLATGTLSPRTIDASPPPGFMARKRIDRQRLVFMHPDELRIRTLDP